MDAVTPKAKHDTAETHSHVVRPADMEWKKTRFPGCEVKGLLARQGERAGHRADAVCARRGAARP